MLILRIRQAEVALADGRLDEAFGLCGGDDARSAALRAHRRGQDVVGRLARALVQRGKQHLLADRLSLALADCGKAEQLAGNLPEVAELRSAADQLALDQHQRQRKAAQVLAAAREQIENGHLASGERLLASPDAPQSRAGALLQDLGARRSAVELALRNARAALDRSDFDAALTDLAAAHKTDLADERVVELTNTIVRTLRTRAAEAFDAGRLDLAESLVKRLLPVDGNGVETQSLQRACGHARQAWQLLDRGRPGEALQILRRLASQFPKAAWMSEPIDQLARAEEAMQALRGGPLGVLGAAGDEPVPHDAPTEPPPSSGAGGAGVPPALPRPALPRDASRGRDDRATQGDLLPARFILQVDGAGSYLVLRQSSVTIGPVSSSRLPDIALVADPGTPLATIERTEDDYFLRSGGNVLVNDHPMSQKLLTSGDRIGLSHRCRMTFVLPNPASTSAAIDLSGARYPRADVRRVILLDRDILLGPGPAAHVRLDHLPANLVLRLRDGRLWLGARPLPVGEPVSAEGVSFVVARG